jgi:ABC-type transport system substrate-binding protein
LTVKLRQDVKFHDGTVFDAAALKGHYDRILNPETKSTRAADYKMLDHVETVDDSTAKYILKFKNVLFVSSLMGWGSSIESPTAVNKYGVVDFQNHPVGSGAFVFKRQEPGAFYEFDKNPSYWRQGQPLLDGFSIKIVPDKAVAAAALNAGEIDAATGAELDQVDIVGFQNDTRFSVYVGGASGLKQIWVNKGRAPGNNIHLRKALSLAINRDEFVDKYSGLAYVTTGPLPKRNPWSDPNEPDPEYNLDKAKEELNAAGYPDGTTISVYSTTDLTDQSDAELLQAQWAKVGIKANFEFVALGVAAVKLNAGEFDFAYSSFGAALGDIDYVMETIFTTGGFFNGGATSDPKIDELVMRGKNEEEDFNTRRATYWEAEKIINDNFYQIWVIGIPDIVVMKKQVHGYIPRSEPGGPGYEQQFRGYWIG